MSIKRITSVWDSSQHSGTALLLLLALADNADDNGLAWPGVSTLAQRARIGERAVKTQLQKLETSGELLVYRRKGYHNFYIVCVDLSDEQKDAAVDKLAGILKTSAETITTYFSEVVIKRSLGSDPTITSTSDPTITRSVIGTVNETSVNADTPTAVSAAASKNGKTKPDRIPATLMNPMKDAIASVFGWSWDGDEPMTQSEKGQIQRSARLLCEAHVRPEQVPGLYDFCKGQFENFGPLALSTNVSKYRAQHKPPSNDRVNPLKDAHKRANPSCPRCAGNGVVVDAQQHPVLCQCAQAVRS